MMAKDIYGEFDDMQSKEKKRPRSDDGGLGQIELRDRWMDRCPNRVWSGGDWYAYANGFWVQMPEGMVESEILDVLEGSQEDGVKVTGTLLGNVTRIARASVVRNPRVWDSNPDALVVQNGTLDISTRTLREHRPEDYATNSLPYEYNPDAKADVFLKVLGQAIPDAVEALQEFAGYSLTNDTSLETAIWLVGPRGSGKSTVIEGLIAMLGERHGILGLAEIEASRFALAKIPGKTLLTSTEQPSSYLKSTHVVDALISGERLLVDRKNRDAQEITPIAKVVWAMNDKPRISNTTSGIFRRVKIIEFPTLKTTPNPGVKEVIKQEGAGILNWALDGLERLRERGGFEWPESVLQATAEFEASNDLPAQFVEEECVTGPEHEIASNFLYEKYKEWCLDAGHKPASRNRVGEDWKRLGFTQRRSSINRFWVGLKLRSSA